jgi:tripartite-type tricarboxylate transporter receptor subunit TctC
MQKTNHIGDIAIFLISKAHSTVGDTHHINGDNFMTHARIRRAILAMASLALVGLAAGVKAQEWPAKPVKMIVPAGPGSAPDVIARVLGERLSQLWGQGVVIDNRPGAGGIPGMSALARAGNDGYTLGFVPAAMATVTPLVYKNPQFNLDTDLQPVATIGISPLLIVAPANAPFSTLAELERHAKANPGKVNFGVPQMSSLPHLAVEMLSKAGGMGLFAVPYPGPPAAISAALAGDIAVTADGVPGVQQHIKSGRLKALGVTTAKRIAGFESIPTVAETYPGYEASGWFQLLVPAAFPAAQVDKLSRDLNQVLRQPEVIKQLNDLGIYPQQSTPASAREFLASQRLIMKKLVTELGLPQQ